MASESYRIGPVRFAYGDSPPCLDTGEFRIERGSVTALAGENGSGKTTLLKLLSGLLQVSGQKRPGNGLEIASADSVYLHQTPYLFHGTVAHNLRLALGSGANRRGRHALNPAVSEALEKVGLAGYADRRARSLSGGESKRVALARVFLSRRPMLLLDEPAAHVDDNSVRLIERAIEGFAAEGRTVVVATHRGSFAYRVANRILDLREGRIEPSASNVLKGEVVRSDSGFLYFRSGSAEFRAPMRDGSYRVAVLAGEDIILSRHPLESSARNCLHGMLVGIEKRADGVLRATVECGISLTSLITEGAAIDLGLEPGTDVYVTFKASSVTLY